MFIEELVDLVNDEIKKIAEKQGLKTRPRYSPGFGDVPLEIQKDFFRLLPCTRIGLTLMDTLIMAPEKSVTAFCGLL
jgi:cobalamin-dependent methionine synthase I